MDRTISDFLAYVRQRLVDDDDLSCPCDPEDCAAVVAWLAAIAPEWELARRQGVADEAQRIQDRRNAVIAGFRTARGAKPEPARAPEPETAGGE